MTNDHSIYLKKKDTGQRKICEWRPFFGQAGTCSSSKNGDFPLCISIYILIAFYLPPWNSFLKSHWNRDESQVKGLTLFCTFQCRYFRNYQIPTFKNYERNWQFSIHWWLQKGTYRRGRSKSSHAWKEIALRLFNSGGVKYMAKASRVYLHACAY